MITYAKEGTWTVDTKTSSDGATQSSTFTIDGHLVGMIGMENTKTTNYGYHWYEADETYPNPWAWHNPKQINDIIFLNSTHLLAR